MTRDSYLVAVNRLIAHRLAASGGIVVSEPGLRTPLHRAVRAGDLERLLPGVYCPPHLSGDLSTRVRALLEHDARAVVLGRSAAALTWWPELSVSEVEAWREGHPRTVPGYRWTQRSLPSDRIAMYHGMRVTDPALTVLDLIPSMGGCVIDEAFRRRVVTLDELWSALRETPARPGNPLRAELLHDSRDEPWSEAERVLHTLVRRLALPLPYRTNFEVTTPALTAFLDLALPQLKLAFEVDGFEFHGPRKAFDHDRTRDLELSAADWEVHRISATLLQDEPDRVARLIKAIVRRRAASLGLQPGHARRGDRWAA